MPYSEYRVKDRQALAQLKYQIRRFKKQMIACGTSQENVDKIHDSLWSSLILAHGSDDFDDDGTPIPEQEPHQWQTEDK